MNRELIGSIVASFFIVLLAVGTVVGTVAMLRYGIEGMREADADIRTPFINAQNAVKTEELQVYLQDTIDGMNKHKYNESNYRNTPAIYRALVDMNNEIQNNPESAEQIQTYLRSTTTPTNNENSHRYGAYLAFGFILAVIVFAIMLVGIITFIFN